MGAHEASGWIGQPSSKLPRLSPPPSRFTYQHRPNGSRCPEGASTAQSLSCRSTFQNPTETHSGATGTWVAAFSSHPLSLGLWVTAKNLCQPPTAEKASHKLILCDKLYDNVYLM